jgi:hypothetical protein
MNLPPSIVAVATEQFGVVTRRQLAVHGVSTAQIRWSLGRSWRQLLPGVVQLSPTPPTPGQCQVAALLYAGQRCWLAGTTAATVLGFLPTEPHARVYVLGPPTVKPRTLPWVTIRRTYLLDERLVEKGPVRLSCRPRAVVDAAALLPDDTARGLLIDTVRERLVRLDDLTHWVEARETTGRPRLRTLVHEAAAGSWSVP